MTDYDGADIIKSYLNGLTWAGLTEPEYYEAYEREDSAYSNAIIIQELSIDPEVPSTGNLRWVHTVQLTFTSDTKSNAFANLKYIVDNIFNYHNATNKMEVNTITVNYTRKRKVFILPVRITELKSR